MFPLLALVLTASPSAPVLTLEEALAEAERRNPTLEATRARLQQAETLVRQVWSNYLPQLVASGNYTYNAVEASFLFEGSYAIRDVGVPTSLPGELPGAPTPYSLEPRVRQEIIITPTHALNAALELRQAVLSPVLWPAIASAHHTTQVAVLDTETTRRDLLFSVAQAYYAATGFNQALQAAQVLLELNQARVKDTQARFEAGTVTRVALLRAQFDLTQAEQNLVQARNGYNAALLALATLLAREPSFTLEAPPPPTLPPVEADLVQWALQTRPEVRSYRENVELALSRRREVLYSYAPSLGFFGRWQIGNVAGFARQNALWYVSASLQWTLWDGGLREAQLREASARVAEAEARLRQVEWQVREEVRRAQLDLADARANLAITRNALELAQETLRLTELSFRAGVATYLEVTDANASLTRAVVEEVRQRLQVDLASLRLLRAAGRFARHEQPASSPQGTPPG
jgi:outer membrane protein TolC